MQYHGYDTTAYVNAHFMPTEKLRLFAELNVNQTDNAMDGIGIDLGQVPGTPEGFNYFLLQDLGTYSHLTIRQVMGKYGFHYRLSDHWMVKSYFSHYNYKDKSPYLFNTTGDLYSVVAAVAYRF